MRNIGISLCCLLLLACQPAVKPVALGTLERERIVLRAPVTELISAIKVSKGQSVLAGQLLLQLDSQSQLLKVSQQQAEVRRWQALLAEQRNGSRPEQLAGAEAEVRRLTAAVLLARQQLKRQQQLRGRGLSSQAELDNASAQLKNNVAALAVAEQQQLQLQHGSRAEVLQQGEAALEVQQQLLAQEQKKLQDLSITASRSGLLEDLPYYAGERVMQGASLAIIAADSAPFARVYLPQAYLTQFQLGAAVQVRVEGRPEPLHGRIRYIAPTASFTPYYGLQQSERARLMFLTEIELTDAAQLPTGIAVQLLTGQIDGTRL